MKFFELPGNQNDKTFPKVRKWCFSNVVRKPTYLQLPKVHSCRNFPLFLDLPSGLFAATSILYIMFPFVCVYIYIYIYIYKGVRPKSKRAHRKLIAAWPPRCLCYRPAVFFHHLQSLPWYSHKEKNSASASNYFILYLELLWNCVARDVWECPYASTQLTAHTAVLQSIVRGQLAVLETSCYPVSNTDQKKNLFRLNA